MKMITTATMLILSLVISCLITTAANAQNTPWTAKLILQHPDGTQDTAWFGCADGGGPGYQAGLDVLDTTIGSHISLLGYDSQVQQQFNPSHTCGNLRTNIQEFFTGVHNYYFYTYSDSLPPWWGIGGNQIKLVWDTMDFVNANPDYPILAVVVYTIGGYINAMDLEKSMIYGVNFITPHDTLDIIYESTPWSCNLKLPMVLLRVEVWMNTPYIWDTGVQPVKDVGDGISLVNPVTNGTLSIHSKRPEDLRITMLNLQGQYIIPQTTATATSGFDVDVSKIPTGVYVLQTTGIDTGIRQHFKVLIVNP